MKTRIAIYLPTWASDLRTRNEALREQPLILFAKMSAQEIVVRYCPLAWNKGIRFGLHVAHARALAPDARIVAHDEDFDVRMLHYLARWVSRFSPLTTIDTPPAGVNEKNTQIHNGINCDISGSIKLFKGSEPIAKEIKRRLQQKQIRSRIAIAPTHAATWALSRYGKKSYYNILNHELRSALAPLPIEALQLSSRTNIRLHEVGISSIGHLYKQAIPSLLKRFGDEVVQRLRLALGEEEECITPLREEKAHTAHTSFSGPVRHQETIFIATQSLLAELSDQLKPKQLHIRLLHLRANRAPYPPAEITLKLYAPSNRATYVWKLLRPRMEKMHFGEGIHELTLTAEQLEYLAPQHAHAITKDVFHGTKQREIQELIDSLSCELGTEHVLRATTRQSHIPERSFRYDTARHAETTSSASAALPMHMPSLVLKTPSPLHALSALPDYPPKQFIWRKKRYELAAGYGPFRITPDWWDEALAASRDYYSVQTHAGTWLWIFRSTTTSRWFLHGIWG